MTAKWSDVWKPKLKGGTIMKATILKTGIRLLPMTMLVTVVAAQVFAQGEAAREFRGEAVSPG